MTKEFLATQDYRIFIMQIKQSIQQAKNKAIRSVNSELISLYYNLGKQIIEKQKQTDWGEDLIGQLEVDLRRAFPASTGFSRRNLNYMRKFYNFFGSNEKVPQTVAQIPWGHIRLILDKIKDYVEAEFYVQKTIENSWSRVILDHQIDLKLYQRQGKIISNFKTTVDAQEVALIQNIF
jgi:predicted nuclease of restriction endonuclease-like (RecB) superfamily